ncbi:MAG: helix-turn-helix transcriptional regulator [Ruminococcaceae bacterium]|nr:helix-turn-helix transcriptional regulator [Oscillospiraceae bacterium]
MTIGANIKRLRLAKNITQEQLSVAMNVTCAAVSKWERGETYPDITLLQPLAYYFSVTLDELMGYNQKKIQTDINETILLYKKYRHENKGREIIVKAYHDYPNDYRIMHYYMWNIAGEADNDPSVLIVHKNEFLAICKKILEEATEEDLRLGAWNMRAKILHAEGNTAEALEIYKTKFTNWYTTGEQKTEQLFTKDTEEYYYWVSKNMYELIAFAGDKLGRVIFFDRALSMKEKAEKAIKYGKLMLNALDETGDIFFAGLAEAFLGRIRNDMTFRGGYDEDIVTILDMNLYAAQRIAEAVKNDDAVHQAYFPERISVTADDFLTWIVDNLLNPQNSRHSELLKNNEYISVLNKYK